MTYIHELPYWPDLKVDDQQLSGLLAKIRYKQGYLLGRMSQLGFDIQNQANLAMLTQEIVKTSAIEGEILNPELVRSSLARRLGIDIGGVQPVDRHIDGIVEVLLDATQNNTNPITDNRLFNWHGALFPTGRSGLREIAVAQWRSVDVGPMQVVSGPIGKETVHFEAPSADKLSQEMALFLDWLNHAKLDDVLRAGIAHFWFVTVHPFEDGNGRIARAIADCYLARADGVPQRFYSMSSQIEKQRDGYYAVLESSQKGSLDITDWCEWFLNCLDGALDNAEGVLEQVLVASKVWDKLNLFSVNPRQRKVMNLLLGDFKGKLTSSKYAKLTKCSQDTALRDLNGLLSSGVLLKSPEGGPKTSYVLATFSGTIG